uniref:MIP20174p n=1 Tax=Drosophila melanogaster TaxID=7227 RepID=D5A7P0_DROME|nr:MIP20174p [Drosophila melanogaster]
MPIKIQNFDSPYMAVCGDHAPLLSTQTKGAGAAERGYVDKSRTKWSNVRGATRLRSSDRPLGRSLHW